MKNIAEFTGKVTFKSKRISCSCAVPYNLCMQEIMYNKYYL